MTRSRLADVLIGIAVPVFAVLAFITITLAAMPVHAYYRFKRWAEGVRRS